MKLTIEKIVQLVYSFCFAFGQFGAVEIERIEALVREFAAGYDVSTLNVFKALHGVDPVVMPLDVAERYACLSISIGALVEMMKESDSVDDNAGREKRDAEDHGERETENGGLVMMIGEKNAPGEIASEESGTVSI